MGHGHRIARALVVLALVVWVGVGALAVGVEHHLWSHLGRVPGTFAGLSERPAPGATDAENFLVVLTGAVTDGDAAPWVGGSADDLLLVHLDSERRRPVVIALPLDGRSGLRNTIRTALPGQLIAAVESRTRVRVDHLVVVTWPGLAAMTDQIGGVTVTLSGATSDPDTGREWTPGVQRLDGAGVLAFVSQRSGLPRGESDRARRQLYVLRTLLDEALAQEMRTQPKLLYAFLDRASRSMAIDDEWSVGQMRALAWSLRNLRSADVAYVVLDHDSGSESTLWRAVNDDTVDAWLPSHADAMVPDVVD